MGKKQKNCDLSDPDDAQRGDYWDFVAFDPEHRLVLAVVPKARSADNAEAIVDEVKQRLGGAAPALMTSDELPMYATAIETTFSEPIPPPARRGPGRPRVRPELRLPEEVGYATVPKRRENGRVIAVEPRQVFGTSRGSGGCVGRVDGEPRGQYVVPGAATRYGPGPQRAEDAQDVSLQQGLGGPRGGDVPDAVQL